VFGNAPGIELHFPPFPRPVRDELGAEKRGEIQAAYHIMELLLLYAVWTRSEADTEIRPYMGAAPFSFLCIHQAFLVLLPT
jgi:hypothetical protein